MTAVDTFPGAPPPVEDQAAVWTVLRAAWLFKTLFGRLQEEATLLQKAVLAMTVSSGWRWTLPSQAWEKSDDPATASTQGQRGRTCPGGPAEGL
jgi:hypothetical protein